jgi:hypothetical protein
VTISNAQRFHGVTLPKAISNSYICDLVFPFFVLFFFFFFLPFFSVTFFFFFNMSTQGKEDEGFELVTSTS